MHDDDDGLRSLALNEYILYELYIQPIILNLDARG